MGRSRKAGIVRFPLVIAACVAALILIGCSIGVKSYEEFRSAVRAGATCAQLLEIKENFDGKAVEQRIERDLRKIGCASRRSARTDR
jgi:hypothetical protein